jgi:hypothetical protein
MARAAGSRCALCPASQPARAPPRSLPPPHLSVLTELPGLAGEAWWDWPADVRDRQPEALEKWVCRLR